MVHKMEICKRCLKPYEKAKIQDSPIEELGQLFLGSIEYDEINQICHECKEELGILNLIGFKT
jgi:hypothetical protein